MGSGEALKTVKVSNAEVLTTVLETGDKLVTCVISVGEFALIGSSGGKVRIYDQDTSGEARAVFAEHKKDIFRLVRLEDALVASADKHGQIFTW